MPRVKAIFYLPHKDNSGRDVQAEINEVEENVLSEFNGWSMTGVIKGVYMMSDKTPAYDLSNAYEVVLEEERLPALEAILLQFKAKTAQEAIYLEVVYNNLIKFL
jgi:hypothetical protein